jgi:hypothetical protein
MPPAALHALYTAAPSPGWPRGEFTYHHLHNHDIKNLASILRNHPSPPPCHTTEELKTREYWYEVKKAIGKLPQQLQSSYSSRCEHDNRLCEGHRGFNHVLVDSIWDSVRHELDDGIGPFLHPLLRQGVGLLDVNVSKMRQLEPVPRMWRRDFNPRDHTPSGFTEVSGTQEINGVWHYQDNKCPACMLARIGSDKPVLVALMAGMVGRYSKKAVGDRDFVRSRRVRLTRYWMKAFNTDVTFRMWGHGPGDLLLKDAWDLGEELRRVGGEWKRYQRYLRSREEDYYGRPRSTTVAPSQQGSVRPGLHPSRTFHEGFRGGRDDGQALILTQGSIAGWPGLRTSSQTFHEGENDTMPLATGASLLSRAGSSIRQRISAPFDFRRLGGEVNEHADVVATVDSPPTFSSPQRSVSIYSRSNYSRSPSPPPSFYHSLRSPPPRQLSPITPPPHFVWNPENASVAHSSDFSWESQSNHSWGSESLTQAYRDRFHPTSAHAHEQDSLVPEPVRVPAHPPASQASSRSIYSGVEDDRYDYDAHPLPSGSVANQPRSSTANDVSRSGSLMPAPLRVPTRPRSTTHSRVSRDGGRSARYAPDNHPPLSAFAADFYNSVPCSEYSPPSSNQSDREGDV